MMNKASKIVSKGITGRYYVNIEVGTKWLRLYQPTVYRICKIVDAWGDLDFGENGLKDISKNRKPAIRGLACALGSNFITRAYYRYRFNRCTGSQLKINTEILFGVLGAKDFFQAASWMRNITMMVAKPKL